MYCWINLIIDPFTSIIQEHKSADYEFPCILKNFPRVTYKRELYAVYSVQLFSYHWHSIIEYHYCQQYHQENDWHRAKSKVPNNARENIVEMNLKLYKECANVLFCTVCV